MDNHKWYFGIKKDDWHSLKLSEIRNSLNNKVKEINTWEKLGRMESSPSKEKKPTQNLPAKNKLERQYAQQQANQPQTQIHQKEEIGYKPKFHDIGNEIIDVDDINYNDAETIAWVEENFDAFFELSGYKYVDMPYFAEREGLEITAEMKKLNDCMAEYVYYHIIDEIKACRRVSKKTGEIIYLVPMAVSVLLGKFNSTHIAYSLKIYWKEIPFHGKVKFEFYDCFSKMRRFPPNTAKKSTPHEDSERMKSKQNMSEVDVSTDSQDNTESKYIKIIIGLIEAYKAKVKSMPKTSKFKSTGILAKRAERTKQQ